MILIVDDDPATAHLIQAILDDAFLTPTVTVSDSALAWPLLHTGTVTFLVLDVRLPTLAGPAFYATLPAALTVVPPVLFITAGPDRLAAYGAAATPVLTKPFTPDELLTAVAAAWPDAPLHSAGPGTADPFPS